MDIQPAKMNQVLRGYDGRMVEIDGDAGMVVADLKAIDPGFGVRLSEGEGFWAVYHKPDERTTHLVLTCEAYQGSTGVWLGLDQRVVKRVQEIGHSSYDFASEVEKQNRKAIRDKRNWKQQRLEERGERAFHEIQKISGRKRRAFFDVGLQ